MMLVKVTPLLLACCVHAALFTAVANATDKDDKLTLGTALADFATRIDTNLYNRLAATATALALEVGTGSGSKDQGGTAVLSLELKKDEIIRVVAQVTDNATRFLTGVAKAIGVASGPIYLHLYCTKKLENQQQRWQQSQKFPPLRCSTPVQLRVTVSATPLTLDIARALTVDGLELNYNAWLLSPEQFFQAL